MMAVNASWDLKDVFKVFLFYFFMMLVGIPILLRILKYTCGLDLRESFSQYTILLGLTLFINIITCLYIAYIIRDKYGLTLTSLGFTTNNWKSDIAFGLKHYFLVLPFIILAGYVIDFVSRLFGIIPDQQEVISKILSEDSTAALAFMVFFGMLAAPIIEEFIFRGFLQSAVRTKYGGLKAIIISSSFFALVHLDFFIFFQIFILGLLLAYLFEKTGSLTASITVHIFHNSATLALLLSFKHLY